MSFNSLLKQQGVIVICRKTYGDALLNLAESLHKGGLDLMEITFDQNDPDCIDKTCGSIAALKQRFGNEMFFGAGTVLNAEQVKAAKQAGAQYIISPNFNPLVVKETKHQELLSIPGAMTPSEILAAWDCGADYVKLFPATTLGFQYIRDIMAPINHVPLVATGGVTEENFAQYLQLGFAGAGISGRLTDKKCIANNDFEEITRRAKVFCGIAGGGI